MSKIKDSFSSSLTHNTISSRTSVKGDIYTEDDFRIDGQIEGNVDCKGKVVMGPKAKVKGFIRCQEADLMGELSGNVEAEGTLSLRSTVILNGDVLVGGLEIEPGAVFNGRCAMK